MGSSLNRYSVGQQYRQKKESKTQMAAVGQEAINTQQTYQGLFTPRERCPTNWNFKTLVNVQAIIFVILWLANTLG
jgi:hypothetical protein